jgi:16S rRNA (cytidine1402-2'-O)-methyltransferase
VVGTPIGNLEDITLRALRVLREVDVIAAEDTRETRKLLSRYDITTPRLVSYREENREQAATHVIGLLENGQSVALVTDAGMPCVSDPGSFLVERCHERGIVVTPVPGPSSFLAAAAVSGLDTTRLAFEGFLSRRGSHRRARLAELARESRAMVFFEAPSRVADTLAELATALGGTRRACIGRELTKKFEEIRRGTLDELRDWAQSKEMRGEFTVVVEGGTQQTEACVAPHDLLRAALGRGLSKREAAREVAERCGVPSRELYELAVRLAQEES